MASKFGDSMNRAITKINVKTSSSLEKSKLKTHIDTLTRESEELLKIISEEVYVLWLYAQPFNPELIRKFELVKQKREEIERLTVEINAIDERDKELFGSTSQEQANAYVQKNICPRCSSENELGARFCRKCGNQLQ